MLRGVFVLLSAFALSTCLCEILIDMSHDLRSDTLLYPTLTKFKKNQVAKGFTDGYWYEANDIVMSEHTSTHIDSPNHFSQGKLTIDKIPFENFVAPAVVIDMTEKAAQHPNAALSPEDVWSWVEEHGPMPDGALVFLKTGWGKKYGNRKLYLGTDSTDDSAKLEFPGFGEESMKVLVNLKTENGKGIVGVGIDTISLDTGNTTEYLAHQELLKHNMYGIENVAKLELLPTTGAEVTVLPMKIKGGSGAPCRILARIPEGSCLPHPSTIAAGVLLIAGLLSLLRL